MRTAFRLVAGVCGLAILAPVASRACIWDTDTLLMEQVRFPGVLEVMGGDFPRHSPEFYERRVARVGGRLAARSDEDPARVAAWRDDLAVALHKIGRHTEAIRVMEESLKLAPGRYETFSNLGTFTIYAGDLAASRAWLQKALAINPDAHFGREKYQLWLVEHLMLRADAAALPEITEGLPPYALAEMRNNYAAFVARREDREHAHLDKPRRAAALQGVSGMMRFADHDNPVLSEALGDLLREGNPRENAEHLAHVAYEFANERSSVAADRERLAAKIAKSAAGYRNKNDLRRGEVRKAFDAALERGVKLNAAVRADEIAWIAAGADVDREFAIKYLKLTPAAVANRGAPAAENPEDFRVVFPVRR